MSWAKIYLQPKTDVREKLLHVRLFYDVQPFFASPPAPAQRFFYGICKVYRTYWIYKMTDLSYNKKINL